MWVRVEARGRCQQCGNLVEVSWRWYPAATPMTSTVVYCEPCVEKLLEGPA